MSAQKVILFDIDGTLFDTAKFGKTISAKFQARLKAEDISKIFRMYASSLQDPTDFNPDDFLKFISNHYSIDINDLKKIFYDTETFLSSLYDDSIPTLRNLVGKYELGIFSQGNFDYQMKKLSFTGIEHFFKPEFIFIEKRKIIPSTIEKLPTEAVIIDNTKQVIDACQKTHKAILLDRSLQMPGPNIIHTLAELKDLLNYS